MHLAYSDRRSCDDLQPLVCRVRESGGSTLNLQVGNAPELGDIPALVALYRFIRQTKADVIHAHSSKAGALARALRVVGLKQPIFYSPHAYYGLQPRGLVKTAFYNNIERVLKVVGHTVNNSHSEARFAKECLQVDAGRQLTVQNGVSTRRFTEAERDQRTAARKLLGLPKDAIIIGTICRVSEQKDPLTLYKAFSRVARARKDLVLYHLGGEGPRELEQPLRAVVDSHNISQQVFRERFRSDTSTVYHALDALMLTSRYEGLSLVLLEAMACNLPLILSDAPGNMDLRKDDLNRVWWGRPGNVNDFAEALGDCILTTRAGCNHREVACARYSQDGCYDTLLDHYEASVMQTGRPARLLPRPSKPAATPAA